MIEATLSTWLGSLSAPLHALLIPEKDNPPAITYRIESEFTPDDGEAPYGANGYRVRFAIWDKSYRAASIIADEVRQALELQRTGYLVSVEDRGDFFEDDTELYSIIIDAEITALGTVSEAVSTSPVKAAAVALLAGNTAAGSRVFASRIGFANCNQFPCIRVVTGAEQIEDENDDQKRSLDIRIDIKTHSTVTSEDELDALVKEVEQILHPDAKLQQQSLLKQQSITPRFSSVGRLAFEHRSVEFECVYYTDIPDGTAAPLNTVAADWNIDQDAAPEAQDSVTIPQE